jgi:hypothetical protein
MTSEDEMKVDPTVVAPPFEIRRTVNGTVELTLLVVGMFWLIALSIGLR